MVTSNKIADIAKNILRREGRPSPDAIGRIHLHVEDFERTNPKTIRVDLYNYGIDGNVPRTEHKQWLKQQLVPFVRHYRYHVKILGRARSSGSDLANRRVSRERVLLLKEFLTLHCGLNEAQVPGNEMRAQEDHFANSPLHEDQRDRSVRLVLSPGWKTKPDPRALMKVRIGKPPNPMDDRGVTIDDILDNIPKHEPVDMPPYDPPRKKYKIRYLGGAGGSFYLGGSYHRYEIMDERGDTQTFRMLALDVSVGVYYNPEPTAKNWSEFTSNAQDLSNFQGRWAQMGTVGLKMYSKTGLAILGADPVELDTGIGLSYGPIPVTGTAGALEAD